MSTDLRKMTMADLLDEYARVLYEPISYEDRERREPVRAEIDRRHADAIEAGGSEVRYALEGES